MTPEEVSRAVRAAAALWEEEAGWTLFTHDVHGGMPVRLLYDRRQGLHLRLRQLESDLAAWRRSLEEVRTARAVRTYNSGVGQHNQLVREWEAFGGPELGTFHTRTSWRGARVVRTERAVDVYAFGDNDELVRLLAHELGHALGLNHVATPSAIMHGFQDRSLVTGAASLTDADRRALRRLCPPAR